ncbi:MAG: hypothetical protein ACP5QR_13775 [Rhizomicrobium sp.]
MLLRTGVFGPMPRWRGGPLGALSLLLGLCVGGCSHITRLSGGDFAAQDVPGVVYSRIVKDCGVQAAVRQNEIGDANPTYTYNRIFGRCMRRHGFAAENNYGLGLF